MVEFNDEIFSISSVLQSESPEQHLRRKEQSNFDLVHKLLKKKHEKIKRLRGFSTARILLLLDPSMNNSE